MRESRETRIISKSSHSLFFSRGVFCLTACDHRAIKPPFYRAEEQDYARRYNLQHTGRYLGIDGEGVCYNDSGYVTLVRPRIAVMMSFGLTSYFTLRACDNKGSCSFEIVSVVPKDMRLNYCVGKWRR